jgi:hypothetical protein
MVIFVSWKWICTCMHVLYICVWIHQMYFPSISNRSTIQDRTFSGLKYHHQFRLDRDQSNGETANLMSIQIRSGKCHPSPKQLRASMTSRTKMELTTKACRDGECGSSKDFRFQHGNHRCWLLRGWSCKGTFWGRNGSVLKGGNPHISSGDGRYCDSRVKDGKYGVSRREHPWWPK